MDLSASGVTGLLPGIVALSAATGASQAAIAASARLAAESPAQPDFLVHRSFGITVRSVNESERSVAVVVSTESVDAYDEVVKQDWDLKRYSANPVVLWNHNNTGYFGCDPEDSLPIGYSKNVSVVGGQLEATLVFVDEKANPLAEKIWQGFRQKSIRAVSAGFRPHTISRLMNEDVEYYELSNNELFEISACPMGANPDAVSKAKAVAQLQSMMSPKAAPAPPTTTTAAGGTKETDMDLAQKNAELEAARIKDAAALALSNKAVEDARVVITERDASITTLTAKVAALESNAKSTEAVLALEKDRADKADARAKTAEDLIITQGVDALVGKKLLPAERDAYVELAIKQPDLYKKMVDGKADLPTAVATIVVPAEKKDGAAAVTAAEAGNGEALHALVEKAATPAIGDSLASIIDKDDAE